VSGASKTENLKPRGFKFEVSGFLFTRARGTAPKPIRGEEWLRVTVGGRLLVLQHADSNTPLSWYDARKVALVALRKRLEVWESIEPGDLDCESYGAQVTDASETVWVRWLGRDDGADPWGKRMEFMDQGEDSSIDAASGHWRRM
jgi:hypothetical protein